MVETTILVDTENVAYIISFFRILNIEKKKRKREKAIAGRQIYRNSLYLVVEN